VSPLTRDYAEPQLDYNATQDSETIEPIEASVIVQHALNELESLASPFQVLLTASILLVGRLTGDEDIAIGTTPKVNGRPFVLRLEIAPKESFLGLALKVQLVSIM